MPETTPPWCRTCDAPLLLSGGCAFCGEGDAVEAAPASRYLRPVDAQPLPARKEYRLTGERPPLRSRTHGELVLEVARLRADLAAARQLAAANGDALARLTASAGRLRDALTRIARGDYDNAHDCRAAAKVAAAALEDAR